jgi:DNA-binding CsgD family transcriptional regulator
MAGGLGMVAASVVAIARLQSVERSQQREIAELAGSGLTDKQIGERLFLSHRTVGARLHQIYPELGISSLAALRDALAALPDDPPDDRSARPSAGMPDGLPGQPGDRP